MRYPESDICAIIPAYNACDTVVDVIKGVSRYLKTVVVVDDGSTDNTKQILPETSSVLLSHGRNKGKGMALRTGFEYMLKNGFQAAITLDADKQHNPDEIPAFLETYKSGKPDIIIGSRMHAKHRIPAYRYIPNRIGVACISWAAGMPVSDSQSGYRLYSRKLLEHISISATGYAAETEIIIKAGKNGFRIENIPVEAIYFPEGSSHYRPVIDTYLICILFLKSFFWKGSKP